MKKCIIVDLKDEDYKQLIIEVENPSDAIKAVKIFTGKFFSRSTRKKFLISIDFLIKRRDLPHKTINETPKTHRVYIRVKR